jgi:hypothetical protein
MLWRLLLILGEYAPLLLSGFASIVAYLLNLRLEDAESVKGSRLRQILKKWVNYRVSQENKSDIFKKLIFPLTLVAAFALMPSIRVIFAYVGNTWDEIVARYPATVVKCGAIFCLAILAIALFFARKYFRRFYAFIEIAIGLTMAWDALGFVDTTSVTPAHSPIDWDGVTGKLFSSDGLKILAAIYVIIRGLVNWDERPKPSPENIKNPAATSREQTETLSSIGLESRG